MNDNGVTDREAIADLIAVLAALLAGAHDRIYPAHAKTIVEPIARLAERARTDGDEALAKSLSQSLESVRQMIPRI